MHAFDTIVIGGGLIGGTIALDLARRGWRVAVLEPQPHRPVTPDDPFRLRVTAINRRSEAYLNELGVWQGVRSTGRAQPFSRLGAWELGRLEDGLIFSSSELCASDRAGANHLGHIVENDVLLDALAQSLEAQPGIRTFSPAHPTELDPTFGDARVRLDDGTQLRAPLLFAADGAGSPTRNRLEIPVDSHDYGQHAVVAAVRLERADGDITWQQFTPEGPRAYLPLPHRHASLVLYTSPDRARTLLDRGEVGFHDALEHAFPDELGPIEAVLERGSFPIRRLHARSYVCEGVVLLGDAAHVIHPLAGQGANLGFRDAEWLGRHLPDAGDLGASVTDGALPRTLARYSRQRRADNQRMQSAMELFHRGFTFPGAWASRVRSAGLTVARYAAPFRRQALRYATWGAG